MYRKKERATLIGQRTIGMKNRSSRFEMHVQVGRQERAYPYCFLLDIVLLSPEYR